MLTFDEWIKEELSKPEYIEVLSSQENKDKFLRILEEVVKNK